MLLLGIALKSNNDLEKPMPKVRCPKLDAQILPTSHRRNKGFKDKDFPEPKANWTFLCFTLPTVSAKVEAFVLRII